MLPSLSRSMSEIYKDLENYILNTVHIKYDVSQLNKVIFSVTMKFPRTFSDSEGNNTLYRC